MIKVIVNDVSLDLKSGAIIALSKKSADIGTLQNRFSSFTNKFQVKNTKKNRDALGLKQYQDYSQTQYQELNGKLISNGLEIASNVAVIIESVSDDITLTIRAGNGNLFDRLNRTKMTELDFSDIDLLVDSRWNLGNVYAYRNHDWTQSFVYPIHDTGVQSAKNSSVIAKGIIPFFYVKDIYERIAERFGYSWTGTTYDLDFFESLIFAIAHLNIDNQFASQFLANVSYDSIVIIQDSPGDPVYWGFDSSTISDPYALLVNRGNPIFGGTFKCYAAPFVGNYSFEFNFDLDARMVVAGTLGEIYFEVLQTDTNTPIQNTGQVVFRKQIVATTALIDTNFTGVITGEFQCENANDDYSVNPFAFYGRLALYEIGNIVWHSGNFEIKSVKANATTFNRWLQWNLSMPDMTLGKFIKEVGNIFGAIYDVDEFRKEIEITRLDEIAQNRDEALDWSDKLDLSVQPEVTFLIDGIARETSWEWSDADQYFKIVEVSNEQLPEANQYVKSDAKYSEERSILLMPNPSMFFKAWDDGSGSVNLNGDLRFAIARSVTNFNLRYSPSLVDFNYKVAYFDYENSPYSLDWSRLYDEYYLPLFEPMVFQMNKIVANFKLSDLDIQSFRFKYPVFIKYFNRYFYVNEISEFTGSDQSTKCTLIAI